MGIPGRSRAGGSIVGTAKERRLLSSSMKQWRDAFGLTRVRLGRRLRFPLWEQLTSAHTSEIVGVVKDSKYRTLGEEPAIVFLRAEAAKLQATDDAACAHSRRARACCEAPCVKECWPWTKPCWSKSATMRENLALALLPARIAVSLLWDWLGLLGVGVWPSWESMA